MRALIREYLLSLRERDELDAILPDILSELGYTVFSRPSRGTTQLGVDVAATGPPGDDRVFLFSIKSGDLTRGEWNGAGDQALRPSLDEIMDAYIPHQLPPELSGKPVVICPCFSGEIRENVRERFHGYMQQRTQGNVTFEVWHGDKLARHLEAGLLGGNLMTGQMRADLRKSIAMIGEEDVSFSHFRKFVLAAVADAAGGTDAAKLSVLRRVTISLWMLFVWSREADDLGSAYRSSELALLESWGLAKDVLARNDRTSEPMGRALSELLDLHLRVWEELYGRKVLPHVEARNALSAAVRTASPLDVNRKLFDLLGRVALRGLWQVWIDRLGGDMVAEGPVPRGRRADRLADSLCALVARNPALMSPVSDGQAVDLALAFTFLAVQGRHLGDLPAWIGELVSRVAFAYRTRGRYPCVFTDYATLSGHPVNTDGYFEEATAGSVLLPTLSFWSAALGMSDSLRSLAELANGPLSHCTMQFWLPGLDSEPLIWRTSEGHGAALLDLPIVEEAPPIIGYTLRECGPGNPFENLSAVKQGFWPMVLVACRHHRLPVPPQVFARLLPSIQEVSGPGFRLAFGHAGRSSLLSGVAWVPRVIVS